MKFPENITKSLINNGEIILSGEIYSSKYFKYFKIENSTITVTEHSNGLKVLQIDNIDLNEWFDQENKNELQKQNSINLEQISIKNKR